MNEIPFIVEDLYYQWAQVPPRDTWPDTTLTMPEKEVEKLYMFYQGLRLGIQLSEAGRKL